MALSAGKLVSLEFTQQYRSPLPPPIYIYIHIYLVYIIFHLLFDILDIRQWPPQIIAVAVHGKFFSNERVCLCERVNLGGLRPSTVLLQRGKGDHVRSDGRTGVLTRGTARSMSSLSLLCYVYILRICIKYTEVLYIFLFASLSAWPMGYIWLHPGCMLPSYVGACAAFFLRCHNDNGHLNWSLKELYNSQNIHLEMKMKAWSDEEGHT